MLRIQMDFPNRSLKINQPLKEIYEEERREVNTINDKQGRP